MNQNNVSGFLNPLNEHDYSTRASNTEPMSTNESSQQTESFPVDGLQVYITVSKPYIFYS